MRKTQLTEDDMRDIQDKAAKGYSKEYLTREYHISPRRLYSITGELNQTSHSILTRENAKEKLRQAHEKINRVNENDFLRVLYTPGKYSKEKNVIFEGTVIQKTDTMIVIKINAHTKCTISVSDFVCGEYTILDDKENEKWINLLNARSQPGQSGITQREKADLI